MAIVIVILTILYTGPSVPAELQERGDGTKSFD